MKKLEQSTPLMGNEPEIEVPLTAGRSGDMSEIQRGLFVGNARAAGNVAFLISHGITHVLNCTRTSSVANSWGCDKYLQLDLVDEPMTPFQFNIPRTPLTPAIFDRAVFFVDRALVSGGRVLVHCEVGASRSVAVVTAFLLARFADLNCRTAQHQIAAKRSVASVNVWFHADLLQYLLLQIERRNDPYRLIERNAARRTLPGQPEYTLAARIGNQICDLLDAFGQEEASAIYVSIGFDDHGLMGAVGRNPEDVRAAMKNGTLHERVAHFLSFFEWWALSPDRRRLLKLDDDDGTTGDMLTLPLGLVKAKEEVVLRRSRANDSDIVNTESASNIGLEVSPRQRKFWCQEDSVDPIPPFRRCRLGTRLSSQRARRVAYRSTQVEFCGPSTHAYWLIRLGGLLGHDPVKMSDLAEVYLASIGAHTRNEVDVALRFFDLEESKIAPKHSNQFNVRFL